MTPAQRAAALKAFADEGRQVKRRKRELARERQDILLTRSVELEAQREAERDAWLQELKDLNVAAGKAAAIANTATLDLRDKLVEGANLGITAPQMGRVTGYSAEYVRRLIQHRREATGQPATPPLGEQRGGRPSTDQKRADKRAALLGKITLPTV